MAIVSAGVKYDKITGAIQAVIIITDDDGKGNASHLTHHKNDADSQGYGWLNIPIPVYSAFTNATDLVTYVLQNVVLGVGISAP